MRRRRLWFTLLGILIAVAASDESLALPAGLLFIAAYSLELVLSLLLYFGGEKA